MRNKLVKAISILRLQPGDVVLFTVRDGTPPSQIAHIGNTAKKIFEGAGHKDVGVIVKDGSVRFEVVRKANLTDEAKAEALRQQCPTGKEKVRP